MTLVNTASRFIQELSHQLSKEARTSDLKVDNELLELLLDAFGAWRNAVVSQQVRGHSCNNEWQS